MRIFGKNSKVVINEKTYTGDSIIVNNNEVIVDGVRQNGIDDRRIKVQILCNVDKIISDESIYINGNVEGNVEAGTSVNCDDIKGNVEAGTSINCDNIYGDASAGTSINCDVIKGNATVNTIIR